MNSSNPVGPIVVEALESVDLELTQVEIYDRPIGLRQLYQDPATGAEHYLIHYPAGLRARRHRHSAAHTIVVLAGRLEVNGHTVGPGTYCHFPAGLVMHHASAAGTDCRFVIVFDGPFDVHPGD